MKKLCLVMALVLVSFSVFSCGNDQTTVDSVMTKERSAVESSVAKSDVVEPVMNDSDARDLFAAPTSAEEDIRVMTPSPVIACECVCPTDNCELPKDGDVAHSDGWYTITIDQSKTIDELHDMGKYDNSSWVKPEPGRDKQHETGWRFPFKLKKGKVNLVVEVIHFNSETVYYKDIIAYLDRKGLRPATTIRELFAFGATNPDVQRKYRIFAVGSVIEFEPGFEVSPYLNGKCSARWFGFDFRGNPFYSNTRFLAVRK